MQGIGVVSRWLREGKPDFRVGKIPQIDWLVGITRTNALENARGTLPPQPVSLDGLCYGADVPEADSCQLWDRRSSSAVVRTPSFSITRAL